MAKKTVEQTLEGIPFPEGTRLSVYPGSQPAGREGLEPFGPVAANAKVTVKTSPHANVVTFKGLEPDREYVAAGEVNGEWRQTAFSTRPNVNPPKG